MKIVDAPAGAQATLPNAFRAKRTIIIAPGAFSATMPTTRFEREARPYAGAITRSQGTIPAPLEGATETGTLAGEHGRAARRPGRVKQMAALSRVVSRSRRHRHPRIHPPGGTGADR